MSPTRNNCAEPLPETLRLKLHRTPVILPQFIAELIYDEYQPVLSGKPSACVCTRSTPDSDIYATRSVPDLPEDAKGYLCDLPATQLPTHLCRAHLARLSRK